MIDSDEIDRVVMEFLDSELGEPDVAATCARHPRLMPELQVALREGIRVRQAKQRAMLPRSVERDSLTANGASPTPVHIGRYELGARIGGGAFGEVYEASADGKKFAIKLLKGEHADKGDSFHRFRKEAEILQELGHPGIVPVYEIGEELGRSYIVMKLIPGSDLARHTRTRPIDARKAARLIAAAADACDYAHRAGVVHRDLKPENILYDELDGIVVTDFGLAKRLDSKTDLTHSLQQLGTPQYMPPEQADRRLGPITARSDVYSLGATLYFLLTGKPPFPREDDTNRDKAIEEVKWDNPKSPREHNPDVPTQLELICLQCLEKWPGWRPSSAAMLADDLRSFLAGRPVKARSPGRAARFRVWCIRHPIPAKVLGIAVAMLITGSALSLHFAAKAASNEVDLNEQRSLKAAAEKERHYREYLANMRDAQSAIARGDVPFANRLLSKYLAPSAIDPRAYEWYYLNSLVNTPAPVHIDNTANNIWNRIALNASADRIACIDQKGTLVVFRVPEVVRLFEAIDPVIDCAFTPHDNRLVVLAADPAGTIRVLDGVTGAVLRELDTGEETISMALSPDGNTCLTGDMRSNLYLCSVNSDKVIDITWKYKGGSMDGLLDMTHGAVTSIAYSPDGHRAAVGYLDGTTQIWDIASVSKAIAIMPQHNGLVTGISFSPDGTRLATLSFGRFVPQLMEKTHGHVHISDVATKKIVYTLVPHQMMLAESFGVAGAPYGVPFGQLRPFFTADGAEVVTTGLHSAQRWSVKTGQLAGQIVGDGSLVRAVTMSADGDVLACVSDSGGVRIWPRNAALHERVAFSVPAGIRSLCGDGNRIVAVCETGVEMTDGSSGQLYSRTGRRKAVVWDMATQVQVVETKLEENVESVARLPGAFLCGDSLVAESANHDCSNLVSTIQGSEPYTSLAVSGDGQWIAVGRSDGSVHLLSSTHQHEQWTIRLHQGEVTALAFSHDNAVVASGGIDTRIYVVRRESGESIATLQGHRREIGALAFSPNGKRLASGSGLLRIASTQGGEVRLWDIPTEQLCLELIDGPADVYTGIAWSADSGTLYTAANEVAGAAGRVEPGRVLKWKAQPSPEGSHVLPWP